MRRHRTLLAVAGLAACTLVVAVAGFLALVRPQRAQARDLSGRIAAAQSQLLALEAERSGSSHLSAPALYQLARAMPADDDVPGIVLDLARATAATGVQLVAVKPAPSTLLADGSSAVPATVVVGGRYANVTRFLRRLRRQVRSGPDGVVASGRLFAVDRADLALSTGNLGTGNAVTATLQLDAFVYGAAPGPSTAAQAPPVEASGAEAAGATP